MEAPLSEPFPQGEWMKKRGRIDGFKLYGKLRVDFFSTSELLYPNMKIRLRLIKTISNCYMICDNPNVSLWVVDCSLYICRFGLRDDHHQNRMDELGYTLVDFNYLEILAKTFTIPARQKQFIQENFFIRAPNRRFATAIITNSAVTGSYTEKTFWYQKFGLRQFGILRESQPIIDFDAADKCRFYVTTKKALNFQDDIPSIQIDNFKDHYVLVFHLISMEDATENHCSKFLFTVCTLTWHARAVRQYPLYQSVSVVLFWSVGKRPNSFVI